MTHKIILVRHGESLANVDPSYYFGPDAAIILSEKGVKQALALVTKVNRLHEQIGFDKIISSKLSRAMITADIACHQLDREIHRDERLNECEPVFNITQDFESNHSVRSRVKGVIDDHEGTLILFCHGELMWHLDPVKPGPDNTEIRIYNRDVFINEHLMKDNTRIIRTPK